MNLNKYAVFAKVCETKNISKAAKELNYTQSGVSQIISNLEKDLGLPLVIRSKNGVSITECGKRLLIPIKRMLQSEQLIEETVKSMQNVDSGHIKVGVFSSVLIQWIPYILKEITTNHPKIEVELIQGDYDALERGILEDTLDCSFTIAHEQQNFVFLPLYKDEYFVILPPDHPMSHYEAIPVEALAGQPLILIDEGSEIFNTYQIIKDTKGIDIQYKIKEDFGAIAMVEKGLGISILPGLSLANVASEVHVQIKHFAIKRYRTLGIATHSLQWATPLTQLFIDTTMNYVSRYIDFHERNKLWYQTK